MIENEAEANAWLRLHLTHGIGISKILLLLRHFQSPEAVLNASLQSLQKIVGEPSAQALHSGVNTRLFQTTKAWLKEEGHWILTLADPDYPQELLHLVDPPIVLYGLGQKALLQQKAVAIVGSRQVTPYGKKIAFDFANTLAKNGLSIVSGLAAGVDTAAHEGSLEEGKTIAVLGTGIDTIYPPANKTLASRIVEHGVLLTEFPLNTPPKAENFPRRNRLIAALAKAVVVVEAKMKSGSLITARLAGELGRDVFAVPGSIYAPTSEGCHQLIKDGALLCTSPEDILFTLGIQHDAHKKAPANDDPLLHAIGFTPEPLDMIAARLKCDPATIFSDLLRLEMAGFVLALPGGRYQRVA